MGIELTINLISYGNPFIRFITSQPREIWGYIEKDIVRIFTYLPLLVSRRGGEGTAVLLGLALIGLTIFIVKKQSSHMILFFWPALIYGIFTFLGLLPVFLSWDDKVLLRLHHFRYWIPILPPLIITGVFVLEQGILKLLMKVKVSRNFTHSTATALLIVLLFFSSLQGINGVKNNLSLIRNGKDHYLELREFLKENNDPEDIIWIIRERKIGYDRILPIYTHDFWGRELWSGTFKYLNTDWQFVKEHEITEGTILIDRVFFNPDFNRIPDYLVHPPEAWKLIFESENS